MDSEFANKLNEALEDTNKELRCVAGGLVREYIDGRLKELTTPEAIIQLIESSGIVSRLVADHFRECTATEIGNRLRCGIYDARAVDRVFATIWTEQFDIAIRDRIRGRVYAAIDAVIAEKLKAIKDSR